MSYAPSTIKRAGLRRRTRIEAPGRPITSIDDLTRAVWSCEITGWPSGYRGTRDAALLVAVASKTTGALGLTRKQARALTLSELAANIHTVERTDPPRTCPRCVLWRWVTLADLNLTWGRGAVRQHLTINRPLTSVHVCDTPAPTPDGTGGWWAFCSIDQHGWSEDWKPMSARAITTVIARRRTGNPVTDEPRFTKPVPDSMDTAAAVAALDEMNDRIEAACAAADEVNARVAAALALHANS